MNLDVSQRHNSPRQVGPCIRVLKEEPQLQSPKEEEPQLQLLLNTGKEPQLWNAQGIGKIVVPRADDSDSPTSFSADSRLACPYHQMDHGVRDPDCDHCKRALRPLYHHKIVGNRHLHRVNMAQYLLVSVWSLGHVRLIWAVWCGEPSSGRGLALSSVMLRGSPCAHRRLYTANTQVTLWQSKWVFDSHY